MTANEKEQLALARGLLIGIGARITSFERHCQRAEYTDTGDAWDVLHVVQRASREALKALGSLKPDCAQSDLVSAASDLVSAAKEVLRNAEDAEANLDSNGQEFYDLRDLRAAVEKVEGWSK